MKTKLKNGGSGFTIVEVMIVLAVTGLMFISVALLIGGKQDTAEFESSIHDVQGQIQQIINETAAGFYPNTGNFSCSVTANDVTITNNPAQQVSQGQNAGCVFLGKVLHFSSGSSDIPNNEFVVYPLAGLQSVSTGTFDQARPTIVAPAISTNNLEYGLNVVDMYANDTPNLKIGSIAFAQSLGSAGGGSGDGTVNGSQSLDLVVPTATGSSLTKNQSDEATALTGTNGIFENANSYADSVDDTTATPVTAEICFQSGTTSQSGLITIGDNSNGISLNLQIFSHQDCT